MSSDLQLGVARETLSEVDLLMVDVMLVAGAKVSFTFGHTALAGLYNRMRVARGAPRSVDIKYERDEFAKSYATAMAAAALGGWRIESGKL